METKYIEELVSFSVRDKTKLYEGAHVLFCHAPSVAPAPRAYDYRPYPSYTGGAFLTEGTVLELFTNEKGQEKVRYRNRAGEICERYLTDSGVVPYAKGEAHEFWNPVNFTVIVNELEDAGIQYIPEGRPAV